MPEFASPMLRRWELGNALRRIREDRGMTIAEVTAAMEEHYGSSFSATKLSRMETAKRGVIPRDVHDLCMLYEVPEEDREYLVKLAKSSRGPEMPIWDEFHRGYLMLSALEQVANEIREYTSMFVPGLLQTPDYARTVERLQLVAPEYYGVRSDPEEIAASADDRVKMRLERQQLLERENPLRLHAILDESVLRRRLATPQVMQDQIDHLISMSKRPHIKIQIMPFDVGLYPGAECSYWCILDFEPGDGQPPRTIYAETSGGVQILDRDGDIARMSNTYEIMGGLALDPDRSRDHMSNMLYDIRH